MANPIEDRAAFRFFTEIGIIEQLVRNRLERGLPGSLKMSQFMVLNHFARLGGEWSPNRLSAAFQVTKGAMTNTLQRLERRGCIKLSPDPHDGRGKLVTITQAGLDLHRDSLESIGPLFADFSKEFPDASLTKLLPTLEKVRVYLDTHR